jgi:hypothetical protein
LSRPNPLRMLITFLAGGMAISVAAGYAIVSALESSDVVSKSNSSNKPIVEIVVGAVSLLVACGVWSGHIKRSLRKRKRPEKDKTDEHRSSLTSQALARGSITMAFIAGLALNLPGVWYLDALAGIAKTKPSHTAALLQILVFNLIMFALVEIPSVRLSRQPETRRRARHKPVRVGSHPLEDDRERARNRRRPLAPHKGHRQPGEVTPHLYVRRSSCKTAVPPGAA